MIIPEEQNNPVKSIAWITYLLIITNSAIFLYFDLGLKNADYINFLNMYGFTPNSAEFQTAFNSIFLHANFKHLVFNMYFLYMFGDNVEDILKKPLFILSYLLIGLFAVYVYYLFNLNSTVTLVGASGAISGILAIYAVMFPHTHMQFLWFYISAKQGVLFWFLFQLIFAAVFMNFKGGIAFSAHIGGFILGLLLGIVYKKQMLITASAPDSILTFERYSDRGDIWCPYCGFKEPTMEFGVYKCSECGTKYQITKTEKKGFFNLSNNHSLNSSDKKQISQDIKTKNDKKDQYHPRTKDLFED